MANRFYELRERLLRAGVAPRHVRRYLAELADHLADLTAEEERAGRSRADAESAALIRLGGVEDLANAMTEQRQLQGWCVRAPWAAFSLAPLLLLAGAWFVALLILWSGWTFFLPGAGTPFGVRVYGFANWYFQLGRAIYFGAPVLIGWGIGLIAARQRFKAIWPAAGLVLVALIGGACQVHVSGPNVPGGPRHVGIGLTLTSSVQGGPYGLFHALILLSVTIFPYLVWRLRKAHSLSD